MKKSIWFWVSFVVAVVTAVYFATRVVMILGGRGPLAYVRTLTITADQGDKDLRPIAAASGVGRATPTFKTRLDTVCARVAAAPGVRRAAVRRMGNGNLSIRVDLHQMIAQWTDGDKFFPISADGTIVQRADDTRAPGAILIRGTVPKNISEIVKNAAQLGDRVESIEWIEGRRWNINTTGGITVMLPQDEPAAAISTLMILDKNHNLLGRDLRVIDMRDSARILVK